MDQYISALHKFVKDRKRVFAAVSGGPDSIFLLYNLCSLIKGKDLELYALHVNYNIRGIDSKKDRIFVEDLCQKLNVIPIILEVKEKPKGNMEDWARKIRYDFFERTLSKYKEKEVFIAHNLDDMIETFFMKIIAGKSPSSVFGMSEISDLGKIILIRPYLSISKSEILGFLEKNKIEYRTDMTNFEVKGTRNMIRNKIIPIFDGNFRSWRENLAGFYEMGKDISLFIERMTAEFLEDNLDKYYNIHRIRIPSEDKYILILSIKKLLVNEFGITLKKAHFEFINDFLSRKGGKYLKISENYYIFKGFEHVYIYSERDIYEKSGFDIVKPGEYDLEMPFEKWTLKLKRKMEITVRPYKRGDYAMVGEKRYLISKFLKKEKIDAFLRRFYPVILSDGKVIVLPGIRSFGEDAAIYLEVK